MTLRGRGSGWALALMLTAVVMYARSVGRWAQLGRIVACASALIACDVQRPVVMPDAKLATLTPLDDGALVLLIAHGGKPGWLARIDSDTRPRWVTPLPTTMTDGLAAHDPTRTRLASDGAFGVLVLIDHADVEERSLGFSLAAGTPLWQRSEPVTAPLEGMLLDRGQSISVRASDPGREVRVHDLRTGALRFTRGSLLPRHIPWHETVRVGELLGFPDDSRGLVLLRRDDGVPRINLPISGHACQLGDTVIGLHDDSVVAYDLTDPYGPPHVPTTELLDALPDLFAMQLRSCHRRGPDVVLGLVQERELVLLTLGDHPPVITRFDDGVEVEPAPDFGDVVPHIGHRLAEFEGLDLLTITDDIPIAVRSIDVAVHAVTYRHLTPFAGGYLASRNGPEGLDLLSLDAQDGSITGAVRVLGDAPEIDPDKQPAPIAGGRLWLVADQADAGADMLRVLDLRTLQPVGGAAFSVVDRTDEARTAWLPPRQPGVVLPRLVRPTPRRPAPPYAEFIPPPWPLDLPEAAARRAGITGRLELLAWRPSSPVAVVFVRHDIDAEGPFWSFATVEREISNTGEVTWRELHTFWGFAPAEREGVDDDQTARSGRILEVVADGRSTPTRALRRRPTQADIERYLAQLGGTSGQNLGFVGGDPDPNPNHVRVDLRRYVAITGSLPRWRPPG